MNRTGSAYPDASCTEWDAHPSLRQASLGAWFTALVELDGDLDLIVSEACKVAGAGVRARFAGFLRFHPGQQAFVLQAGTGWRNPEVGRTLQPADLTTTAGLAWHSGQLLHFRSLRQCGRVQAMGPMRQRGVDRLLSVPITGNGRSVGILEVGDAEPGGFASYDKTFLRGLAHSLQSVMGRGA